MNTGNRDEKTSSPFPPVSESLSFKIRYLSYNGVKIMDCIAKQNLHKFEKKVVLSILFIGLTLVLFTIPAMAVTGTFDSVSSAFNQDTYYSTAGGGVADNISGFFLSDTENWTGFYSLYSEFTTGSDTSPSHSGTLPVTIYYGATTVGTGLFGYSVDGTTYKVWLYIYSWNPGSLTGLQTFNFTTPDLVQGWNFNEVRGHHISGPMSAIAAGVNRGYFNNAAYDRWVSVAPVIIRTISTPFHNRYNTSYAAPITSINVSKNIGGLYYPSTVYVMMGTVLKASNTTLTSDNFLTNLLNVPYFTVNVSDAWGNWYISPLIYGSGTVPIYNISISPNNISIAQTTSGGIYSSLDTTLIGISAVNWQYYVTSNNLVDFYENSDNIHGLNYVKRGSNWYGWNVNDGDFTNNKGTSMPNPVILFPQSAGDLTVFLTIYTLDGNMVVLTAPLTVGQSADIKNIILEAADWQSGMLLSPINWSVKNLYTTTWSNKTSTSGDGSWNVQYPAGTTLYVEANAYGYAKGTLTKQVPQGNDIWILQLYPLSVASGNVTNSTLLVKVLGDNNDGKFQPLNNVAVTLSDKQSQLTASLGGVAGQAQFTVKNDTIYQISAKKDKYVSVTKQVFVTGDIYTATLFMSPLAGSTVIPTTATPRPTATPTVSLSGYQPLYGNFTGFWAPFENMGVAMGAQPSEVGILMMFLLIIGFLILGGWAAGPLGAEVGVVAGMVCSVAFGFLPFAISIAVIAILCLYGALRIWGVTR